MRKKFVNDEKECFVNDTIAPAFHHDFFAQSGQRKMRLQRRSDRVVANTLETPIAADSADARAALEEVTTTVLPARCNWRVSPRVLTAAPPNERNNRLAATANAHELDISNFHFKMNQHVLSDVAGTKQPKFFWWGECLILGEQQYFVWGTASQSTK